MKDKLYADFTCDFETGMQALSDAVGVVSNTNQGRIDSEDRLIDWGVDWDLTDERYMIRFTSVEWHKKYPMTFLTEVAALCDEELTKRYKEYENAGVAWFGQYIVAEMLFKLAEENDFRVLLDSTIPQIRDITIADDKTNRTMSIRISVRKMGNDTGKDQLIDVNNILKNIRDQIIEIRGEPSKEHIDAILALIRNRQNA